MARSILNYSASIKFLFFGLVVVLLTGCMSAPPKNINNACSIVQEYPSWFYSAQESYNKYGIPISVQFAIVRHESHFVADAKPPRKQLLGFIPWSRISTAYGYSQALNGTWSHYKRETGNYNVSRTDFNDAIDFVGWYCAKASNSLGISKTDAYTLYLAYHDGIGGYRNGTYKKKTWLLNVAKSVQNWSWKYASQLKRCDIPSQSWF